MPCVSFLLTCTEVRAALDAATGHLTWTLQSIDPETGKPPTDPSAGFLPPGASGAVSFSAMPKAGISTGTKIQNQATVIFDDNLPINTPVWANTIDDDRPVSQVDVLPQTESHNPFVVQWTGADVGSGLQDFTIWVSQNGGKFMPWLTNVTSTEALFSGAVGVTYAFYSLGRDSSGNIENKIKADTMTTVTGIIGDVNGDGVVDCNDVAIVKDLFGRINGQVGYDPTADLNGDGVIDVRDLAIVSRNLPVGTKCQ